MCFPDQFNLHCKAHHPYFYYCYDFFNPREAVMSFEKNESQKYHIK